MNSCHEFILPYFIYLFLKDDIYEVFNCSKFYSSDIRYARSVESKFLAVKNGVPVIILSTIYNFC